MEAITNLVDIVVWPGLILFIMIRFGPEIKEFFSGLGEVSLKAGGVEASAKRRQAEAVASLAAAVVSRPEEGASPEAVAREARAAAELVSESVTPRIMRRAGKARVLWVDDRPSNNVHERQSLQALGINFVLARSTDEALDKLNAQSFDAIISDMSRPSDPQAGYTLLRRLKEQGDTTPFIIYAGKMAYDGAAEARKMGAFGSTNRPNDLFEMVLKALGQN